MDDNQKKAEEKSPLVHEKGTISGATKGVLFLSALIAIISLYIILSVDLPSKPMAGQDGSHEIAKDVKIGGKFTLTDQNGNKFSSDQMKGHFSLVYFGFTYCPDVCPTTLTKLSNIIDILTKYKIDVMPIFISVDPERDTPAVLKEYLSHFNPKFVGLSGSPEEVRYAAELYKVFYTKSVTSDTSSARSNYMIDHSSFVYLMDRNGKYMKHFYMNSTEDEIVEYIRINK